MLQCCHCVSVALVGGTDQGAVAEHIGDDQSLHFAQTVDRQLERNDEPVVAEDNAHLGEHQQEMIGGLGIDASRN